MAGAGYRDWAAGNVPTAAQFDTYLQEQTVMVFASASARDTALSTAKSEGMVAYLLDSNTLTVYTGSGSVWSTLGPVHAWTAWTPTIVQPGSVTVTVNQATYIRFGREVTCRFHLTCTGTGTAANAIALGGFPVTASAAFAYAVGVGKVYDSSANLNYQGIIEIISSTQAVFMTTSPVALAEARLGISQFTAALASGDQISGTFTFEAAGDA